MNANTHTTESNMITKIEITEYLKATFDGTELDTEYDTDEYWDEAAGYMDEYIAKVTAELTEAYPDAELEIDWRPGLGNGKAAISVVSDADDYAKYSEEDSAAVDIDYLRGASWEAIW